MVGYISSIVGIMKKNLFALLLATAFIPLFSGCATCTDENAVRLAVTQSNEAAQRKYQVTPFRSEDGKLWTQGNHFVWDAHTSANGHDMVAKVTFDRNGAVATVDVQMQDSRLRPER